MQLDLHAQGGGCDRLEGGLVVAVGQNGVTGAVFDRPPGVPIAVKNTPGGGQAAACVVIEPVNLGRFGGDRLFPFVFDPFRGPL